MKALIRYIKELYSGPFQATLVFSFTLVAAVSIGIGTWVIANTINRYLTDTMDERVLRDIHLANTFYDLKLAEIVCVTKRLAANELIQGYLSDPETSDKVLFNQIENQMEIMIGAFTGKGNHLLALTNAKGSIISAYTIRRDNIKNLKNVESNWGELPIVQDVLKTGSEIASTEVIPGEMLEGMEFSDQAKISILDTPKAAPEPYDPREGSAGLVLMAVIPVLDQNERVVGTVLGFYMFNNDYTLVDQIKDAAQIDSVTIFLGDLRVSTNVKTTTGERAVGTRLSQEVGDVVLINGSQYVGTAFVVNEDYITCYEPLRNYNSDIVGIIYVGVRQSLFLRLLNTFDRQISLVAGLTVLITFFLATPVSRAITRPLKELRELSQTSQLVTRGDLSARAPIMAGGEVGQLAQSFNKMLDTLQVTQDQLVHSEKLASLGQLAAGVAHELNNPLGTILLYSDIILHEGDPSDQHRTDLETIVKETKRCKSIVAALLDFARQHQVDAQEVDINSLVVNTIDVEKRHSRYDGVKIEIDLLDKLPKIQADPMQIQEVILNLLQNAADAMPKGGEIKIRTRNGSNGMVTVEVEDNGSGIAPENLPKIFTPFFTTKPVGIGIGLGLAITYGIIKMHRGQISVQSQPGVKTLFTFSLPLRLSNINLNAKPARSKYLDRDGMIG